MKTGIYKITNKINGKIYVGQARDIASRFTQHKCKSRNPKDPGFNSIIHVAFRKYGIDAFDLSILEECSVDELDAREKFWITELNSLTPNGYNVSAGGQKIKRMEKFCVDCGCPIGVQSKSRCRECNIKHQSKNLNMIEMGKIVYENRGFEGAGRILGVSGKAISNWFKRRMLPFHTKDVISWYLKISGIEIPNKKTKKPPTNTKVEVIQCDLEGNQIKKFSSIREAARELGFSDSSIHAALKRTGITHGFLWKKT